MNNKYSEISSRIIIQENKYDANLICIEMDDSLIFVDTSRRYDVAREFRREMEQRFKKKASYLLITHYHFDHYGGISAFKDIEIIAAENNYNQFFVDIHYHLTKDKRETLVEKWKNQAEKEDTEIPESRKIHWKYFSCAELYPPTKPIEKEFQIGREGEKVIFRVTGGHSKCSAYVYIPSEKTAIIGDNIAIDPKRGERGALGYSMQFYRLGLNQQTLDILKKIEQLPIETIIPGHGPAVSLNYVSEVRTYFESLFEVMKFLYKKEKQSEEIAITEQLQEFYDEQLENWESIIKQQYNTIVQEEIERDLDERKNKILLSICSKKLEDYLSVYSDNSEFLFLNGYSIEGKEEFRSNFAGFSQIIEQEYLAEQYNVLKDKIVERGKYSAVYELGKNMMNYEREYVYSWKKENGEWKIISDMTISEKVY